MTNRTAMGIVLLVLAQGLAGCDRPALSPTGTTTGQPQPTTQLAVTGIAPKAGLTGTTIRISGAGFSFGAIVTLGGTAARVGVVSSTFITATTPASAAGTVDVVVTNPNGQLATLAGGYTFESVTLTVSSTVVAPGGQLSVSWVAPSGQSSVDWLGLFKVEDPNTSYESGWWQYTSAATSGTMTLSAPTQPGQFEFRYLAEDGYIDAGRSPVVTVRASGR